MFSIVAAKLGNVFIKEMTPFRFLILTFVSSMPRICSSKKRSNTVTRRSWTLMIVWARNSWFVSSSSES